jgi:alpha-galactosidase
MVKVTLIGAGSLVFCKTLIADILNSALKDIEFCLMDLNVQKLEWVKQYAEKVIVANNLSAKVTATTDRLEAIKDAKYIITTFQIGGIPTIVLDYEIPMKHGVDQCIGDTLAPGGIFRALRTIPVILDMAKDIEEISPQALILNYVNPMSIVGWALGTTKVQFVGLCHGVQVSLDLVASYTGVPKNDITYLSAGINHMAWFLKLEQKGRNLYPELREKFELSEYYANEKVRGEVFRNTGFFMTESTGHLSEYLPYFRKNRKALDLYCNEPMFGGESGAHVRWAKLIEEHFGNGNPLKDEPSILPPRGIEYGSYIIEAIETGVPFHFQGNVINEGMIANLPPDSCVEGPMYADDNGLHKTIVGSLPSHLAALNLTNINVHRLTVEASLAGDPEGIVYACALDPLTSAALTLKEIREMASEMLETQRKWLPQFAGKSIRPTPIISIPKGIKRVEVPVDPALAIVARFDELAKKVT